MKTLRFLVMVGFVGIAAMASNASAQFVGERVDGSKRVCIYRANPNTGATKEYETGLGNSCSTYFRASDPNRTMPPTARLSASAVRDGKRFCTYSHGGSRWSAAVALDTYCPMTAGLLERSRSNRSNQN